MFCVELLCHGLQPCTAKRKKSNGSNNYIYVHCSVFPTDKKSLKINGTENKEQKSNNR